MAKYTDAELNIANAVWHGQIDGLNTCEVADMFSIPQRKALAILKDIISGNSPYQPFEYVSDYEGVRIKDGSVFVRGDDGDFMEGKKGVNHYVWFLT